MWPTDVIQTLNSKIVSDWNPADAKICSKLASFYIWWRILRHKCLHAWHCVKPMCTVYNLHPHTTGQTITTEAKEAVTYLLRVFGASLSQVKVPLSIFTARSGDTPPHSVRLSAKYNNFNEKLMMTKVKNMMTLITMTSIMKKKRKENDTRSTSGTGHCLGTRQNACVSKLYKNIQNSYQTHHE